MLVNVTEPDEGSWADLLALSSARRLATLSHALSDATAWQSDAAAADDPIENGNALYRRFIAPGWGGSLVFAHLGSSLDGRIATAAGHSHFVNGDANLRHLHRLRALCDAVVVGTGTVALDDPRLTTRLVPGPSPMRIILDPRGSAPPDRVAYSDGGPPVVVVRRAAADPAAETSLPDRVEIVRLPDRPNGTVGGLCPHDIRTMLAQRGLLRVLVEGGGRTVSAFLQAGALDRLHLCVAPMIIGSGRAAITLPEIATLDEAVRCSTVVCAMGNDVMFDLDLRTAAPGR